METEGKNMQEIAKRINVFVYFFFSFVDATVHFWYFLNTIFMLSLSGLHSV